MAIEHIITDTDTIQTLAIKYLNDINAWTKIVDYNGLSYPYIVQDPEELEKLYASGFLRFQREFTTSDLTIFKGSTFSTVVDLQGMRKVYEVVEDTLIPTGQTTGYVFVRCVNKGTFGNVLANSITELDDLKTNVGLFIGAVTVTNEETFTNGIDGSYKVTGEAIYIPVDGTENATISNIDSFLNLLGGEDLELDDSGFLVDDGFGDISSLIGLDNILQAVKHRLTTEMGDLIAHPEDYGTHLAENIGGAQLPYMKKLMELDIQEALALEDRITNTRVTSIELKGTSIYVDLLLEINNKNQNIKLVVDL